MEAMFYSARSTVFTPLERFLVAKFRSASSTQIFAVLLGIGLLAYLAVRTGPQRIWSQVEAIGWGITLIIVLGGIAHLVKTWAWRLTLRCDLTGLSWARSFGMRLISEAIGQVGIAGKFVGEGMRVSMLKSIVPAASGVSSAALDSGLYMLSSAIVTTLGIASVLLIAPVSQKWRLDALLFVGILVGFVGFAALAMGKQWQVFSNATRAIGGLSLFKKWISAKQSVIETTESKMLNFHREASGAFWGSFALNFLCHALAVAEVVIILRFMGFKVPLSGALMLEGLTKLINSVGAINPGNVGTYEAGNVLITRLLGITGTSGLTLALCRRVRAIFWAAIGALCLVVMKRSTHEPASVAKSNTPGLGHDVKDITMDTTQRKNNFHNAIIFANCERNSSAYLSSLAQVGTLPVLLRTILTLEASGIDRVVVCVPSSGAQTFMSALLKTKRLPLSVEWREVGPETKLWSVVAEVGARSETLMLILGNRLYQPGILQSAAAWSGAGTLALTSNNVCVGIKVFSKRAAIEIARQSSAALFALSDRTLREQPAEIREVSATAWHEIVTADDIPEAERKLDTLLIKPTDGLFARMNRRISIPISRQIVNFPITANMVTLFVLGVSFASGLFFARGGYWSALAGSALSVAASILDGCDGEVARLKLQSTKFGCWLETVCDYLYYLFVFGGMAMGLTRTYGDKNYLAWGGLAFFGAITSFLVVSYSRQRLSGAQPEKFLAEWQKKAETRPSNLLLFVGRNTEFIIRRCFFPYALLFFCLINMTRFAFIATALGANIVWIIALYSVVTFFRKRELFVLAENPATQ
jgi:phosphatidylglycerophosphate synthase